jgi:hypothetical protein
MNDGILLNYNWCQVNDPIIMSTIHLLNTKRSALIKQTIIVIIDPFFFRFLFLKEKINCEVAQKFPE